MANPSPKTAQLLPPELIERRIYLIRGHKVMLSPDLATLLSGRAPGVGAGGEAQFGPVPLRFHVSVEPSRVQKVEITNCDFKLGRGAARTARRVHRARWRCRRASSEANVRRTRTSPGSWQPATRTAWPTCEAAQCAIEHRRSTWPELK